MKKHFWSVTFGLVLALVLTLTAFADPRSTSDERINDDQIDLQYAICEDSGDLAARRLGMDDGAPKITEVVYYDARSPKYVQTGATFRVKIGKSEEGPQSSVKLRFSRREPQAGANCEWDRYGSTENYTCAMEATDISAQAPWTDEQRRYAAKRVAVNWSELVAYGPYPVAAWKMKTDGYKFKLDSVNPPAPLKPLIELSVKVRYGDRATAAQYIEAYLRDHMVQLCPAQEPKTLRLFRNMGILR